MALSASTRFEFRVRPETKKQIEHAAGLVHESALIARLSDITAALTG